MAKVKQAIKPVQLRQGKIDESQKFGLQLAEV